MGIKAGRQFTLGSLLMIRREPASLRGPMVIVEADVPALIFASVPEAAAYMEPIDVLNGVYTAAFGTRGEPYKIETDGYNTTISLDETAPSEPDRLKDLLLQFLDSAGVPAEPGETLEELLAKCAQFL